MTLFDVSIVRRYKAHKCRARYMSSLQGFDMKRLTEALEQESHCSSTCEMQIAVCDGVEEAGTSPASSKPMMIDSSYWTSSKEAQDLVVSMTNLRVRCLNIFNFLSFPVPLLHMWLAAIGNCNDHEKQRDYTVILRCDSCYRGTFDPPESKALAMAATGAADKRFRGKLIIQVNHLTDWEALRSRLEETFLKPYHPNNSNPCVLEGLTFEFLENATKDFTTRMDENGMKLQYKDLNDRVERLCSSVPTRNIKMDLSSAVHINTVLQALHSNPFPHLETVHIQSDQLHFSFKRSTLQPRMTSFRLKIMSTTIDYALFALFSSFLEKIWLNQQRPQDDNSKAMLQEPPETKITLELASPGLEGRLEQKEFQFFLKRVCSFPVTSFFITAVSTRLVSYVLCQSLNLNSSLKCLNVKTLDPMDWVTEEVIQAFQNNHSVESLQIPNFARVQRTERDKTAMTRKLETIVKSSCSISSLYLFKIKKRKNRQLKVLIRSLPRSLTLKMHMLLNESGIRKAMMMRSPDKNGTTVLEWIHLLESCKSLSYNKFGRGPPKNKRDWHCGDTFSMDEDRDSSYLSCVYYMFRNDMDFILRLGEK